MMGPKQEVQSALFYEFSIEEFVPLDHQLRGLDLTDPVPDHSLFSKNRHGRFRESGLFRHLFETVLQRCIDESLVGGHSFGVDANLNRVKDKFNLQPERLIADTAYGSGPMLDWLVKRKIAPHIPVIDKAGRTDGTWSRADFEWDPENNQYAISMRPRKKIEMLFAHLKRILGLGRLQLRGPCGANNEFLLAATAQNLRKLVKIFPAPQQIQKA